MKPGTAVRIFVYLLIYLGLPIIAWYVNNETVTAVCGIVYILLLIPIGILRMIEFYRANDGTTWWSRTFNILFRFPLALFGLVCIATGLSIIGWVLYNVLVERQKEYTGPDLVIGLSSFGVGAPLVLYGWFVLRSVLRRKEVVVLNEEHDDQDGLAHEEEDEEHSPEER